jgi:alpha-galactosidase
MPFQVSHPAGNSRTPLRHLNLVAIALIGFACAGSLCAETTKRPLKVFIMAGQSNMQGKARVSTIARLNATEDSRQMYQDMTEEDGTPVTVKDVHVAYFTSGRTGDMEPVGPLNPALRAERDFKPGDSFGPEYTFGIYMQKHLNEPFLIIKTAWGGKGLLKHFRPPSATEGEGETGPYYVKMMDGIKKVLADPGKYHPAYDKDAGYEIAGFVWFQAWNDLINGFYQSDFEKNQTKEGEYLYAPYARLMASFIRDIRKDLKVPAMPFVIGAVGVNGPIDDPKINQYWLRKAQEAPAAMPEFKGTVAAVQTAQFWDMELMKVLAKLRVAVDKILDEQKFTGGPRARNYRFDAMKDEVAPKALTEHELKIYSGASNAPFHYMGSAYTYGKIGKAFAEAMVPLLETKTR